MNVYAFILMLRLTVCDGPYQSAPPLAVLLERSFLGLDAVATAPKYVLYSDGTVLFKKCKTTTECAIYQAQLTDSEFENARELLSPSDQFLSLKSEYTLIDNVSDLPQVDLMLQGRNAMHRVSVNGLFYEGASMAAYTVTGSPGSLGIVPAEFERYRTLVYELLPASSRPWRPSYYRISLSPFSHYVIPPDMLSKPPLKWPREWPTPSPQTRVGPDEYEIFIPATEKRRLDRLNNQALHERGFGVLIQDQRWVFDEGEPVVPGACVWDYSVK